MDKLESKSSISNSPSKTAAVSLVEGLRKKLFESDSRKVPFKALFTAIMVHLGRVLFQIVVTISGFFPTLIVASHIGGFILERWFDIFSVGNTFVQLKKAFLALIQISILVSYCYFLISFIYAPIFFVFVGFISSI